MTTYTDSLFQLFNSESSASRKPLSLCHTWASAAKMNYETVIAFLILQDASYASVRMRPQSTRLLGGTDEIESSDTIRILLTILFVWFAHISLLSFHITYPLSLHIALEHSAILLSSEYSHDSHCKIFTSNKTWDKMIIYHSPVLHIRHDITRWYIPAVWLNKLHNLEAWTYWIGHLKYLIVAFVNAILNWSCPLCQVFFSFSLPFELLSTQCNFLKPPITIVRGSTGPTELALSTSCTFRLSFLIVNQQEYNLCTSREHEILVTLVAEICKTACFWYIMNAPRFVPVLLSAISCPDPTSFCSFAPLFILVSVQFLKTDYLQCCNHFTTFKPIVVYWMTSNFMSISAI